jgi:hypothetical protein
MIDDDTLGNLNGDVFTPGIVCTFFLRQLMLFMMVWDLGAQDTEEIDLASINH